MKAPIIIPITADSWYLVEIYSFVIDFVQISLQYNINILNINTISSKIHSRKVKPHHQFFWHSFLFLFYCLLHFPSSCFVPPPHICVSVITCSHSLHLCDSFTLRKPRSECLSVLQLSSVTACVSSLGVFIASSIHSSSLKSHNSADLQGIKHSHFEWSRLLMWVSQRVRGRTVAKSLSQANNLDF